jgi:hypothetical protein
MDLFKKYHFNAKGQAAINRGLFAHFAPCASPVSQPPPLTHLQAPTVDGRRIVALKGTPL